MISPFLEAEPQLDSSNFVAPTAAVIGDVRMGKAASIWFNAVVRADVNWIRIGEASNIQDNAVVHVTSGRFPTDIGDYVTVAHSAVVHGCTVRDRVLIGIGAIVLDGAEIGSDTLIGAGSLVTQGFRIPPRSLVLGRPARVVRELDDSEVESIHKLAERYIRYSAIYRGEEVPEGNPFYQRES